ncbi:MAG: hypothetical protein K6T83_16090 [Alicyclobacillus sp.]|nr:hypothetical protein [Alicyclobacillus sp.]
MGEHTSDWSAWYNWPWGDELPSNEYFGAEAGLTAELAPAGPSGWDAQGSGAAGWTPVDPWWLTPEPMLPWWLRSAPQPPWLYWTWTGWPVDMVPAYDTASVLPRGWFTDAFPDLPPYYGMPLTNVEWLNPWAQQSCFGSWGP